MGHQWVTGNNIRTPGNSRHWLFYFFCKNKPEISSLMATVSRTKLQWKTFCVHIVSKDITHINITFFFLVHCGMLPRSIGSNLTMKLSREL